MCGIVGYTGDKKAVDILLQALSGLEYRGYDSAGISVEEADGIRTVKAKGRLSNLEERVRLDAKPFEGRCGIGHTRWATHGEPNDTNAHPHVTQRLSLVHNGIIENYQALKATLSRKGYSFPSLTDTEVAAKLLDSFYEGDPVEAIRKTISVLEGSYAFAILFNDFPGEIFAVRQGSPLICAKADGEAFLASDIPAILQYTRTYALLEERDILHLTPESITIHKPDGQSLAPSYQIAQWSVEQAQKGGFPHFMLKEIFEQPQALLDTVRPRIADHLPSFEADSIPEGFWKQFDSINIVACGTAWHAGMVGKNLIERLARLRTDCVFASEFRYNDPILDKRTLVVVISQSGETADTLAALRLAKEKGATTLAVVNVTGSSIAREADYVIHTYAGPEIAVASTKAYTVQLSIMYLVAMKLGYALGHLNIDQVRDLVSGLLRAIGQTNESLKRSSEIKEYVRRYKDLSHLFFLGRGLDYAVALEGSLKLKEISYIHCEAYAAGELKHGTISLITQGVPVVAIATQEDVIAKMISNMKEVSSRGAEILMIGKAGVRVDDDAYFARIDLPAMDDLFMPIVCAVVLQLLAYHTAILRECDVDHPRNLAKSVTVE